MKKTNKKSYLLFAVCIIIIGFVGASCSFNNSVRRSPKKAESTLKGLPEVKTSKSNVVKSRIKVRDARPPKDKSKRNN